MVTGLYDATPETLAQVLAGEPAFRVRQVWDGLYRRALPVAEMTDLPLRLRSRLEAAFRPSLTEAACRTDDRGQTVKWLWRLHDGAAIETVSMHYPHRSTVCVSTQAGCAMGCGFCATGQAGFSRHLSSGEIVEQVVAAIRASRPRRVSNVVFMGMGEPLANYDRVWAGIVRLHHDVGFSARHLTVSTVGVVPGIRRLAGETLPVNLAVSLHAANDNLRNKLVPVNRQWPLGVLRQACHEYVAARGRRLSIEWALIDGVNDRRSDASELARFAAPLAAHVNLIPLNPTPGSPAVGTPPERVRGFRDHLRDLGVNATIRQNRGTGIAAACGQLAAGRPAAAVSARRREPARAVPD